MVVLADFGGKLFVDVCESSLGKNVFVKSVPPWLFLIVLVRGLCFVYTLQTNTRIYKLGALGSQCSVLCIKCPRLGRCFSAHSALQFKFALGSFLYTLQGV